MQFETFANCEVHCVKTSNGVETIEALCVGNFEDNPLFFERLTIDLS
jgi:hypothetical protein